MFLILGGTSGAKALGDVVVKNMADLANSILEYTFDSSGRKSMVKNKVSWLGGSMFGIDTEGDLAIMVDFSRGQFKVNQFRETESGGITGFFTSEQLAIASARTWFEEQARRKMKMLEKRMRICKKELEDIRKKSDW